MMKKWYKGFVCALLALTTVLATGCPSGGEASSSSASSSSSSVSTVPAGTNLFGDPDFEQGFAIFGTGINGADRSIQKTVNFQENASTVWSFAQWYSQHKLDQGTLTNNENLFKMQDEAKMVQLNKKTGEIKLALNGAKEFTSVQTPGAVFWPHLLLQQSSGPLRMRDCQTMRAYLKFRMDRATDCSSQFGEIPICMQAQFAWFIYVKNVNPDSPGLNEFLWFGFNLYDPTKLYTPTISQQDFAGGTLGNYIYAQGSSKWNGTKRVKIGETYELNVDMFAAVEEALEVAHNAGFMSGTTIDDVAITGTNIGFEVFDVWDMQTTIFDIGVYYT